MTSTSRITDIRRVRFSVIVSVARKDLVQPGSEITIELLKSIQLSFDFVPKG
jgi:hypothetical protein